MECHATLPAFRDTVGPDSERDFKQAGGAVGGKNQAMSEIFLSLITSSSFPQCAGFELCRIRSDLAIELFCLRPHSTQYSLLNQICQIL